MNYLFGYGSLISRESREKSGESGIAIPVRVQGFRRRWFPLPLHKQSGVGAVYADSFCNGVIVPVSLVDLLNFDKREPEEYERVELERGWIKPLDQEFRGRFWTYITRNTGKPAKENPIAQSYVDVIVSGCLEIGDYFAREFISSTDGWKSHWVNDRENPKYPRSMKSPNIKQIDKILKETIPSEFAKRNIE